MKVNKKANFFLAALVSLFALALSCKKDDLVKEIIKVNAKEQRISEWLSSHGKNLNKNEGKALEVLKNNLNYIDTKIAIRKNGDSIIVIPLKEGLKQQLLLTTNSVEKLMIIQSNKGKMKWSAIVSFIPTDGKKVSFFSENTLKNILNNEEVNVDGVFKFLDIKGRLLYQIEYRGGKIHSYGNVFRASKLPSKIGKDGIKTDLADGEGPLCIDWYLAVTVYDEWGNVINYSETYLFTTCTDDDGGGGGGGGDDPIDPEEPIDHEIESNVTFTSYEDSYTDDDYSWMGRQS